MADRRLNSWTVACQICHEPLKIVNGSVQHARMHLTVHPHCSPEPAWNYQLDGYVPQEGDWVLVRWVDGEDSEAPITERAIILSADQGGVVLGAVDAPGTMRMLPDELRHQMGVAYYRPPGPPPVPDRIGDT